MVLTHLGDADSLVGLLATKGPLWKNDNFYTDFSVVGQKKRSSNRYRLVHVVLVW